MREMMEVFPAKLQKLWNNLEIRILVLLSLFLQIILITTGSRRKYSTNKFLTVLLWLSYLSADAVATIALGVLSQAEGGADAKSSLADGYAITALWAPFLLIHLGGPDTITAYALADNELWARHLLGLVTQVGVAVYIFLRSWTGAGTPLNYLWMVIFASGLIKYGERTWVLFSASKDRFRDLLFSRPDAEAKYANFMEELVSKELEGHEASVLNKYIEIFQSSSSAANVAEKVAYGGEGIQDGVGVLQEANSLFGTFIKLFADSVLSLEDGETSRSFFTRDDMKWHKAFSIVEAELGLIYDLFYTKAFIIYSLRGFFLRWLSWCSTVAAFVAFLVIDKNIYPTTEVIITYILLLGAIAIEFYAIVVIVSSDRMMIWLSGDWATAPKLLRKFKNPIVFIHCKILSLFFYLHIIPARIRWSNAMGQYSLLKYCLTQPKCADIYQYLEKYLFWSSVSVPKGLKALIFHELHARLNSGESEKMLGSYRGDEILLKQLISISNDDKNRGIEFDQSLLLWHLATDFCYHMEVDEKQKPNQTWLSKFILSEESSPEDNLKFKREICKLLSDHMMHLLIVSPSLLPSGIGQIRFQDTCSEAIEFFDDQKLSIRNACQELLGVDTRLAPSHLKGERSKSLLFDACRLAKSLQSPEFGDRKWDIVSQAWLDILTFAAAQSKWNDHAEKLSQGGELLTHVWLLMAHHAMTDQVQLLPNYLRSQLDLR